MARVNISIPDELKARMDGLNCNWSAIAQKAFMQVVEIEQLKSSNQSLEAGLLRLRGSKRMNVERERTEGFIHGQTWALEEAKYDQLEELAQLSEFVDGNSAALEKAVAVVTEKLKGEAFDLPGMPEPEISAMYAAAYLKGVADVFSRV